MKKVYYLPLLLGAAIQLSARADVLKVPNITPKLSTHANIQSFLKHVHAELSESFPYRINIFTEGEIDKNSAGLRVAERAKQFFEDNGGLLFYYELLNNAMRVPHWHANAMEVGVVLEGKMRVTIWEGSGDAHIFTVEKNNTWIIPKAKLHALENVGSNDLKFLVTYDSPIAADRDFITAWASLPNDILAQAVGLTVKEVEGIKKATQNKLSSFDPAALPEKGEASSPLSNSFETLTPLYQGSLGRLTRVGAKENSKMGAMALQQTILKPQVLRTPHWYTSGDVLLYVEKGVAFFSMMNDKGKVFHALIKPGDLISIPVGNFHTYLNIGEEDLVIYESFNQASDIREITLLNGLQHFSTGTMEGALSLSKDLIEKMKREKADTYMMPFTNS